eukprot:5553745-Pleurochrysis_carterae.AAC.1
MRHPNRVISSRTLPAGKLNKNVGKLEHDKGTIHKRDSPLDYNASVHINLGIHLNYLPRLACGDIT